MQRPAFLVIDEERIGAPIAQREPDSRLNWSGREQLKDLLKALEGDVVDLGEK